VWSDFSSRLYQQFGIVFEGGFEYTCKFTNIDFTCDCSYLFIVHHKNDESIAYVTITFKFQG